MLERLEVIVINVYDIAKEVERKIRNIFPETITKMMIYGSYANGTFDDESDVDLIVLVNDTDDFIEKQRERISEIVAEISSANNIFVSVIIRNDRLFYERSTYVPFYMNVARDGVVIHE